MKNFILFIGIIIIVLVIGGLFINTVKEEEQGGSQALVPPTSYEYFWSETCPHCANVNEFMQTWSGREKIELEKYEVTKSFDNKKKFVERGTFCRISRKELGVPLLITPEGICLVGDEPIIEHLKNIKI